MSECGTRTAAAQSSCLHCAHGEPWSTGSDTLPVKCLPVRMDVARKAPYALNGRIQTSNILQLEADAVAHAQLICIKAQRGLLHSQLHHLRHIVS
eukprot:1161769-Pelagomonas_calceolata.AAC.5